MNPLKAIRKRRRPLAAEVLTMLGIVWLNMVLQPCLMAGEMDMDMSEPCPHCLASMTGDCDGAASSGCTYFDRVDHDGRSPHSKLTKKVDHSFVSLTALPAVYLYRASTSATGPPCDVDHRLPALAINVLHCVYLN